MWKEVYHGYKETKMEQKNEMKLIVPRVLICGVCSAIPACCVKYYLEGPDQGEEYVGGLHNPEVMKLFLKLYGEKTDKWPLGGIAYTVCPDCLKRKRVIKILNCKEDDDITLRPGIRCFFRNRPAILPNWGYDYGPVLESFITLYEEGMEVSKGYILVKYESREEESR